MTWITGSLTVGLDYKAAEDRLPGRCGTANGGRYDLAKYLLYLDLCLGKYDLTLIIYLL